MANIISHQKIKKVFKYLQKVFSYACIAILALIAIFFANYFIEKGIARAKGQNYTPRVSLYTIISPSMIPTINVYDIVFDVKVSDPSKIKKGDVITFISSSSISSGLTVTHRVTKVIKTSDGYEYYTKGDANMFEDGATARSSNLIGKVIFKIPQLGRVQFFLTSKIGWLICILLPALAIIAYDVYKLNGAMKISNKGKELAKDNFPVGDDPNAVKNNILKNSMLMQNKILVNLPKIESNDLPKLNEEDNLPKLK